jgi:hypothetical protein
MGEQHLDALAVATRLLEGLGLAERTSRVAGIFIDAARDLARRLLRASHLEWAHVAVELARPMQQLLDIHDPASVRLPSPARLYGPAVRCKLTLLCGRTTCGSLSVVYMSGGRRSCYVGRHSVKVPPPSEDI